MQEDRLLNALLKVIIDDWGLGDALFILCYGLPPGITGAGGCPYAINCAKNR